MRALIATILLLCTAFSLVIAPPPPSVAFTEVEALARQGDDSALATLFPHVPPEQRRNIGTVPPNLRRLIQGADAKGRLILPKPAPNHAPLLTQPSTEHRRIHGVGILAAPDGSLHYFRTGSFVLPPVERTPTAQASQIESTDHVPFDSSDTWRYPARKLKIDLGDGHFFKPKGDFVTSHISVLPMNRVLSEDDSLYHSYHLSRLQYGPGQYPDAIEWSSTPNWSDADKRAYWASSIKNKMSPKSWFK